MSLLDSPLLEQNDILQPLVETTGTRPLEPRIIKKARRRRSIAVIKGTYYVAVLVYNRSIEFENETPTKQFNGLKDMLTLTPETDDEQAKQNKDTKKEMSYSRPTDQVGRKDINDYKIYLSICLLDRMDDSQRNILPNEKRSS